MPHDDSIILGHEQRLSRAETRIDNHAEVLESLESSIKLLATNFSQIKFAVIGGVLVFVGKEAGLVAFLSGVFK